MTKPTFSILVDTEENTNLAIQQLTQIALEEGIITQEDLEKMFFLNIYCSLCIHYFFKNGIIR